MTTSRRYCPEIRERVARLVFKAQKDHQSERAAMSPVSEKIGGTRETLRRWVRQAQRDQGLRPGMTSQEKDRVKELEREVRELERANEILRKASAFFRPGGAPPQVEVMVSLIDDHRSAYGVESICRQLQIAPSTYYEHKARERDPDKQADRQKRDAELKPEIDASGRRTFASMAPERSGSSSIGKASRNCQVHDRTRDAAHGAAWRDARRLRTKGNVARGIRMRLKSMDFQLHTRQRLLAQPPDTAHGSLAVASDRLDEFDHPGSFRLVGMAATGLYWRDGLRQLDLFEDSRHRSLETAIDALSERFGRGRVLRGYHVPV